MLKKLERNKEENRMVKNGTFVLSRISLFGIILTLLLLVFLLTILSTNFISAQQGYSRSFTAYTNQPTLTFTGGEAFQLFDRAQCQAGQDFVLQVSPLGCTPSVVRSDLLEEQNVPVFCPIVATQLNPLIDVKAVNDIIITGQTPREVSGIGFQPAQAALGNVGRRVSLDSAPILDNIGYAVVVLRRQPNETAMPDFVEGNLTARIRYDIKNAFGVGQATFYLPVLDDREWEEQQASYSFWQGRGFLRAESVTDNSATVSIYSDREATGVGRSGEKRRIATETLETSGPGRVSRPIPMPGFNFCFGTMELELKGLENPDTRARVEVNGNPMELKRGEGFIENKCQITDIDKKGINEKITVTCNTDDGRDSFELGISPRVNLEINGSVGKYSVGQRLYEANAEKSVYLVYVGTANSSTNENALSVGLAAVPGHVEELSTEDINSLAGFIQRQPDSVKKNLASVTFEIFKFFGSATERALRAVIEGQGFRNVEFGEEKEVFGTEVSISGFADAVDLDISGLSDVELREHYGNAIEDYETIKESYSQEQHPVLDETLGETALGNEIIFQWAMDQKRTAQQLCDEFEESYPSALPPVVCTDARKLSSPVSAVHDVTVLGKTYRIVFDEVNEPTFDEFGATIFVNGNGINREFNLRKDQIVTINETTGAFIQLLDVNTDSVQGDSVRISTNLREGVVETVGRVLVGTATTITLRENRPDSRQGYTFSLQNVNLGKVAKVSVNPNIHYAETNASFNFKIGIEKRGIQLTPEQTKEKIESVNNTLETLNNINDRLGDVVSAGKLACFGVGTALTVKNFFANIGGEGIARQKVMRAPEIGWFDKCTAAANRGEYSSVDSCLLENNDEIERSIDAYKEEQNKISQNMENLQQGITQKNVLGEDVVDTEELLSRYVTDSYKREVSSNLQNAGFTELTIGTATVSVSEIVNSMNANNVPLTQARNIQLNSRLLENPETRDIALTQLRADLSDFWVNSREETERGGFAGIFEDSASLFSSAENLKEIPITSAKRWGPVKSEFSGTLPNIHNNNLTYKLKDRATAKEYLLVLDNDYVVRETYEINNGVLTRFGAENEPNPLGIAPKFFSPDTYKNKCENCEVRYYEQGQYAGLPAIVPFDTDNGWYAAIKSSLPIGGNIKAFDDSGRISSFWLCNIGENKKEEFGSGVGFGDDICQQINLGTGQPYNQFPGLDPNEASRKVTQAVEAIAQASRSHRAGISSVPIQGRSIPVGRPMANIPDIQCQDFMSSADCSLLFNICDPVICPSSRCDFGGRYPVEDVVQSGVVGGLLLCLPNFPEVKVPVCLSAVHAGLDAYSTVLDSYQQCLQTSLETGQQIGICDELNSVYQCEFFWRQGLPLAQAAVPLIAGEIAGQATRGGGEYLGVQDAFQRASDSASFFTQTYAVNSFEAFKARNLQSAGTEVCRNWISYTAPGDFIDTLTAPDSPNQFYGRFDEVPFTTATNPPVSQYKVFYHVYAGKDFPAYYQVYLRGSGSSFFQDNPIRIVAQGFAPAGEFRTETRDFTAPSGYKEMCIVVNGREECGFKEVTTDLGLNYMTELYVASQANDKNIQTEAECVSGRTNIVPLLSPNIQSGVEEGLVDPAIYNRGIVRVCATDSPGKGSDQFWDVPEQARWRQVGTCGNANVGCWLDSQTVRDVIKDTAIEDSVLQDSAQSYVDTLNREVPAVDFDDLISEINDEESLTARIQLINENLGRVFLNQQRGFLTLLRGDSYVGLALEIYNRVKPAGEGQRPTTQPETPTTKYPVLEFEDGSLDVNIYYTYFGNTWLWTLTPNVQDNWINVNEEPDRNVVRRDADIRFIESLRNQNYASGLQLLMQRVTSGTALSTSRIEFTSDKIFTYRIKELTQQDIEFNNINAYFRFIDAPAPGSWHWSSDRTGKETLTSVNDAIPNEVPDDVAEIIDSLTGKNSLSGAQTLFEIDAVPFQGRGIVSPSQTSCGDCGKGLGNLCDEAECRELSRQSGVQCSFEDGFFRNTCKEEPNTAVSLNCFSESDCRQKVGNEVIKIAQEIKQQRGVTDSTVKQDTGVETFECLVLMVANVESSIRHCVQPQVNSNPLYCEGDSRNVIGGDGGDSLGIMQINTDVHNVQAEYFRTNVEYGVNLLIDGHTSTPREYVCNSQTYRGWTRALRQYNGWPTTDNIDCTKGNRDYVEDVLSQTNRNAVKNLFPEVCGS